MKIHNIIFASVLASACLTACLAQNIQHPYGICAHLPRMSGQDSRKEVQGFTNAGFNLVRFDADWSTIEPTPDSAPDYSRLERALSDCRQRQVEVLLILPGALPRYALPTGRHKPELYRFVRNLVTHFKGRITHYEVFNEVDCTAPWGDRPDPLNYTKVLVELYRIIKDVDPANTVLFSGLSDFHDPFPFWEKAFQAGALDACDAVNMHPYQMHNVPEQRLPRQIRRLKALMRTYGQEKPIWITEIGNATSPFREDHYATVVKAAFQQLGWKPENITVGLLADDEAMIYTDAVNMPSSHYLPPQVKTLPVTFKQLDDMDLTVLPAVALPPNEEYVEGTLHHLLNYVRRGGTLIIPGSLPFYFRLTQAPDGSGFDRTQVNDAHMKDFHLAWFTPWTRPGTPTSLRKIVLAKQFSNLRIKQLDSVRFLADDNLKANDAMIPIVIGTTAEGFQAPTAALYTFDSDLKGAIIAAVSLPSSVACTEEKQAIFLVRTYLLALAEGVQRLYYYRWRASEFDDGPESHYGIAHVDHAPKPAVKAARVLVNMLPHGSTRPQLQKLGSQAMKATWTRPDGVRAQAIWGLGHPVNIRLADLSQSRLVDINGKPLPLPSDGILSVSMAPVYLLSKGKHATVTLAP